MPPQSARLSCLESEGEEYKVLARPFGECQRRGPYGRGSCRAHRSGKHNCARRRSLHHRSAGRRSGLWARPRVVAAACAAPGFEI